MKKCLSSYLSPAQGVYQQMISLLSLLILLRWLSLMHLFHVTLCGQLSKTISQREGTASPLERPCISRDGFPHPAVPTSIHIPTSVAHSKGKNNDNNNSYCYVIIYLPHPPMKQQYIIISILQMRRLRLITLDTNTQLSIRDRMCTQFLQLQIQNFSHSSLYWKLQSGPWEGLQKLNSRLQRHWCQPEASVHYI